MMYAELPPQLVFNAVVPRFHAAICSFQVTTASELIYKRDC